MRCWRGYLLERSVNSLHYSSADATDTQGVRQLQKGGRTYVRYRNFRRIAVFARRTDDQFSILMCNFAVTKLEQNAPNRGRTDRISLIDPDLDT